MGAIISYPDHTLAATLSGGSWSTASPLLNLINPLLGSKARTTDDAAASSTILIDLGATARAIRCVAALAHNISSAGTIRARGYSDSGYTTLVSGADTTAVTAWPSSFTAADVSDYPKNWIYCFTTAKTARYWKIEISDTSNPDSYIELGRLWLGEAFEPAVSVVYGASLGYESRDLLEESLGGIVWGEKRTPRRTTSISFPNISNTEKQRALIMQKTLGTTGELLWVMNSAAAATDMLLEAFPATVRAASPLSYPYYNNNEMPLELQEIV